MTFQEIELNVKKKMEASMANFRKEISGIRTGRASANFLDHVFVEAYGSKMPINQVATISVPEARLITVQVWDNSLVKATEKAIAISDLGVNPATDGQLIRVPMPNLSEERRKDLVKIAKKVAENSKISIRNIRRDGNDEIKKLEKNGEISKDDLYNHTQKLQEITDEFTKIIDSEIEKKEKDILSI